MQKMGLNEIREKYLEFFESKQHLRLPSFSLVPENDESLLIINAGMAPLKDYFTGQRIPPSKRVTTCQKCVRTGDIENVGKTARHGTFFEMLGNFSFGDYFKGEIIPWAWEFITEVLKLPKDKLWVTVYEEDDEAKAIWIEKAGVPADRIVKLGKGDNFWEVGSGVGPCGPCSEIYYDRGEEYGCGSPTCGVGCDCDRYVEFWNLVFTQFDQQKDGSYKKLEHPNIDTGMGLERIATIMQGVDNIFEVDTIREIVDTVAAKAGIEYGKDGRTDMSVRIISDHVRSIAHMISDGILPSNGGRGYVLRRLLRRAARHCKLIGINDLYLHKLVDVVIKNAKDAYPVLVEKQAYIKKVITKEEERFAQTLDQGLEILNGYIKEMENEKATVMSGDKAFKLYDTFGFPVDLTKEILEEKGINVDEVQFNKEMEIQKEKARSTRKETSYMGRELDVYSTIDPAITTEFVGYTQKETAAKILVIVKDDEIVASAEEGDEVALILDKTPLYVEMGGQVSDNGIIESDMFKVNIYDCKRTPNGKLIHVGKVLSGTVSTGENAIAKVNSDRRSDIARNHTATHMLDAALRSVIGTHVEQAGSLVTPERLRFDFTHFEALTKKEITTIENIVNEKILEGIQVNTVETSLDKAKEMGAIALFGEKYGEIVRVVKIGDYSMELCGGTHIDNTSRIGMFKIVSEGSVAAGVRRIEAITGKACLEYIREKEDVVNNISIKLKSSSSEVLNRVETLITESKELQKEIESLKSKLAASSVDDIIKNVVEINGVNFASAKLEGVDADSLRNLGDALKNKLDTSIVLLASVTDGKVVLLSMATKDAVLKGVHCGNIIREVSKMVGGGGGGRPDMAQAGGKDAGRIDEALIKAKEILENTIK